MSDIDTAIDDKLDSILVTFGQILQRHSPEDADTIRIAYRMAKRDLRALLIPQATEPTLEQLAVGTPFEGLLEGNEVKPAAPSTGETLDIKEKLAAIEHERWADWQEWCHKILRDNLGSNNEALEAVLERWDKQIVTKYEELSDQEKASDMEQVNRYWPLIERHVAEAVRAAKVEIATKCFAIAETRADRNIFKYLEELKAELEGGKQ